MLLSTTRELCEYKLRLMTEYCIEYGMVINPSKSKFMVVNGAVGDRMPITSCECTINHCDDCTYLFSLWMVNSHISQVLKFIETILFRTEEPKHAVPTDREERV